MKLSPRTAKTVKQQLALRTTTCETPAAWIFVDGAEVSLATQRDGEPPTGQVRMHRRDFHTLIDWYQRDQRLRHTP